MSLLTQKDWRESTVLCGQCSQIVEVGEIVETCHRCGQICLACKREHDWVVWKTEKGVMPHGC